MVGIKKSLDIHQKLTILSQDSRYDLACACGTKDSEHRRRSKQGTWIYPVALPQGGTSYLFKTLLSNECKNDCKYCPLRVTQDTRRCTLEPGELVRAFLAYIRAGKVSGLFLSSGVLGNPDVTMSRINAVAKILRKNRFRGYMHLKVIPGASAAAIRESLALANAVSLNIETAGEENFRTLSKSKNYFKDIIQPLHLISRLTQRGAPYAGVKQTTQFVVGAARETDKEIVSHSWNLYRNLKLHRIYFSAYQRGRGDPHLAGEQSGKVNSDILTREHRLYQVDWLIRKYGFSAKEIQFEHDGNLSLTLDPKEVWAKAHPEYFPVNVNRAPKYTLLRVPGLGALSVERILQLQKYGEKISSLEDLGRVGKRLHKAAQYITF